MNSMADAFRAKISQRMNSLLLKKNAETSVQDFIVTEEDSIRMDTSKGVMSDKIIVDLDT